MKLIPELINMFLAGFIFMSIYNWLSNSNIEIYLIGIWSLFVNELIKLFYSTLHSFIFVNVNFNEYFKYSIYVLTGAILPFIVVKIRNHIFTRYLLTNISRKTIDNDVFKDVLDLNSNIIVTAYLKDSNLYYIGTFKLKDEHGIDSYIALIDYSVIDKNTDKLVANSDEINSIALLNLHDIERLELTYEDDSKVWSWLNAKKASQNSTFTSSLP